MPKFNNTEARGSTQEAEVVAGVELNQSDIERKIYASPTIHEIGNLRHLIMGASGGIGDSLGLQMT